MNSHELIKRAIEAGALSNKTVSAFDFAGNYRPVEVKSGEVVFEHIITRHFLHWVT